MMESFLEALWVPIYIDCLDFPSSPSSSDELELSSRASKSALLLLITTLG
jgi:hypothetical protein